jgi:hypothetical protein
MVKFSISQFFLAFLMLILPIQLFTGLVDLGCFPVVMLSDTTDSSLVEKTQYSNMVTSLISASNRNSQGPILLHYLIRLIGNDWLGADWVYLGLTPYRYPQLDSSGQQVTLTDPITGIQVPQWSSTRFWIDPGPALLKSRDVLWVWGYLSDAHTIYADTIQVNPPSRVAAPIDVSAAGYILAVSGENISLQDQSGIEYTITVDSYTTFSFPPNLGLPRPEQGLWLNISKVTGAGGLLGRYDGYHGDYHGLLRLDFNQP